MRLIFCKVLLLHQISFLVADFCGFGYELIIAALEKIQNDSQRIEQAIQALSQRVKSIEEASQMCPKNVREGVYQLNPVYSTMPKFPAYCKKGWIVIQRRTGTLDFNEPWNKYKEGFGPLEGEHWLGLEKLHQMTRSGTFEVMISVVDSKGVTKKGTYESFTVSSELEKYQLHVGAFNGDSGLNLLQDGARFTSRDQVGEGTNCSENIRGWWRLSCDRNSGNSVSSVKYTSVMMIRPV